VSVLVEQRIEKARVLSPNLAKTSRLRTVSARSRLVTVAGQSDVANKVEGVVVTPDLLGEFIQNTP